MPVQYSLEHQPTLVSPITVQDCDIVLDSTKGYYIEAARQTRDSFTWDVENLRSRINLALLSVNSPFDATVKAHKAISQLDPFADWELWRRLKSTRGTDGTISYAFTKTKWLLGLSDSIYNDGVSYFPFPSDMDYRDYLRQNIKGLAWAKSSYAAMLILGDCDVCCIDTHMYRLFTGSVAKTGIGRGVYLKLEEQVRQLGKRHGVSCSVTQHCLWDAIRGERTELLP